jgi:hypothetical protein
MTASGKYGLIHAFLRRRFQVMYQNCWYVSTPAGEAPTGSSYRKISDNADRFDRIRRKAIDLREP